VADIKRLTVETKALIAVPKSEIDRRQAEYEKKKGGKKKKAA